MRHLTSSKSLCGMLGCSSLVERALAFHLSGSRSQHCKNQTTPPSPRPPPNPQTTLKTQQNNRKPNKTLNGVIIPSLQVGNQGSENGGLDCWQLERSAGRCGQLLPVFAEFIHEAGHHNRRVVHTGAAPSGTQACSPLSLAVIRLGDGREQVSDLLDRAAFPCTLPYPLASAPAR